MSTFSENAKNKESRLQDYKTSKKELGKYFYDLSKATYVAMVLGCIVAMVSSNDNWVNYIILAILGLMISITLARFAFKCFTFNK